MAVYAHVVLAFPCTLPILSPQMGRWTQEVTCLLISSYHSKGGGTGFPGARCAPSPGACSSPVWNTASCSLHPTTWLLLDAEAVAPATPWDCDQHIRLC